MIRDTELLRFLESISSTVANELRPELHSGGSRKSADSLIQVLDRLVAQLRDGETIAAAQLETWQRLARESPLRDFPEVSGTPPGSLPPTSNIARLDELMRAMQRPLLDERQFAALLRDLQDPHSPASAWLSRAAAASFELWESVDESVRPAPPRPAGGAAADDPERLRSRLNAYLAARHPRLGRDAVESLRIVSGGSTKLTALVGLHVNSELPCRCVLRQDVAMNMTGTRIVDEFPVIERLFGLGIRVPRPLLVEPDAVPLGSPFMLMEEVLDSVPAGTYFARDRARSARIIGREFGDDAARELARLHRGTALESEASSAAERAGKLRAEVAMAHQQWKSMPHPPWSLLVDLGFAWLQSHPLGAERPRCLIHGDYGVHNMMVRDGRLAAVLDWELAVEDDPAIDLAECRMLMVEDTLPWSEFVASYLAAGGDPRACEPAAVDYFCVWMFTVKFGLMLAGARQYFVGGARTDSLMASAASHSMDRILQHLARALHMVAA